jgi:hypothetical protein
MFGLAAVSLLTAGNIHAEDIKTWGHVTIFNHLSNDKKMDKLKTHADAEVDFSKTMGKTSVRLDLDVNQDPSVAAKGIGTSTAISIEQAKFVRELSGYNGSLAVGVFNSPIGFTGDTQDHTDRWQFSNSQLFALRPANLAGGMWSWWGGPAVVDIFYANDFNGQATTPTKYENSVGGKVTLKAKVAQLEVGYITSERTPTSPAPIGAGNLLDVVVTGGVGPHTMVGFEYLDDEKNSGWALTGHYKHGVHGVTARYDSLDFGGTDDSTSLTLALSCAMMDSVETVLEWNSMDPGGTSAKTDKVTLAWVAKF